MSSIETSFNVDGMRPVGKLPPVRLLHFITSFGFGGTERQVVTLMRGLDHSRFDLRFACLKRWGQFLGDIEQQAVPIAEYRISSLYKPGTFRHLIRLALDLRRWRTQIVHSYNFYGNVFAVPAAWLAGVPVIIASIRDIGMDVTPAKLYLHLQVCRLADRIVVNADAIREWLIGKGIKAGKITVIRNGIDPSRFDRPADSSGLRPELGLPAKSPMVLLMARLTPQKGIEEFLDAASIVHGSFPDAYFVIVGDLFGPARDNNIECDFSYRDTLIKKTERMGIAARVLFTGYRSDVPEFLSQAALSVSASHCEGLPNVLMESMAAGVPVVATNVGGSPEVVGADGVAGLLVPPRDAESLAKAICALLADPELSSRLGEAARQRMVELFSVEHMVDQTEQLYKDMLAQAAERHRSRGWFAR